MYRRSAYYPRNSSYSRSANAERCEERGCLPLTRAIARVSVLAQCPPSVARRVLLAIGSREWHHVGKYATPVDYYETEECAGDCRRRSAVEIAERVCTVKERARIVRRWPREAFRAAAERALLRQLAAYDVLQSRLRDEEIVRRHEARHQRVEMQKALTLRYYQHEPTPGRAQWLRQHGVEVGA